MRRMIIMQVAATILSVASLMAMALPVSGQEFRVDSEVFAGEEKQPFLETLTIFTNGIAYDFQLTQPREITIFDPGRGSFTMLDETRQVKAVVSTDDLLQFTVDLETRAASGKNSLLAFAARPEFNTTTESVNENGQQRQQIKMVGKPLEYFAVGQPAADHEIARIYRDFANWSARLNATLKMGLPPAARVALNTTLAEQNLLPLDVKRTIHSSSPLGKREEVRSHHLVNGTLSNKDRQEIARASNCLATFRQVSYDEYRSLPAMEMAAKQAKK